MAYYLQLDGVDDKVVIPNNPVLQFGVNTFSIEVRLKIKSFPASADRFILGKRPFTTDNTAGLAQFSLKLNSDKTITFSTFNSAESFVKSTVLVVDTEYLISVCRRADGNITLYVDGVSVANTTLSIRNVTNNSDMWFGGNNRDNNAFANIDFKEVRFWNIETTSSMVQSNKNIRLNGNESGLLLYYGFQEGSGTVITDKTITGLNGTLTGGTWLNEGGVVGSIAYTIKNQIYSTSLFNYDSKQFLYQTSSQLYDSRIEQYKTDSLNYDNKQIIYNTSLDNFDMRNVIYNSSSITYDTKQIIYETLNVMYDTLQQIFNGGLIGSTKFDTSLALYANYVKLYDTKQSYYQTSTNGFDLKQSMYKVDQINGDTRFSIYKNGSSNMDLKQSIYSNDTKPFDTKQSIFTNNFIDFNVRNEIFKQQSNSFDVKQIISKLDTAEFSLKQAMYRSSGTDYDTLQQMLSDFQVYRQVIQYILNINTKNNYNLEIALRKKFNMKL